MARYTLRNDEVMFNCQVELGILAVLGNDHDIYWRGVDSLRNNWRGIIAKNTHYEFKYAPCPVEWPYDTDVERAVHSAMQEHNTPVDWVVDQYVDKYADYTPKLEWPVLDSLPPENDALGKEIEEDLQREKLRMSHGNTRWLPDTSENADEGAMRPVSVAPPANRQQMHNDSPQSAKVNAMQKKYGYGVLE